MGDLCSLNILARSKVLTSLSCRVTTGPAPGVGAGEGGERGRLEALEEVSTLSVAMLDSYAAV